MRLLLTDNHRRIAIEDATIVAPDGRFDATLDCRGATIRPGLINAHDHLHRNHYGRLGFPPYANAYRWAEDIQQSCAGAIALGRLWPRRAALLEGAWKNLFAGVTTVVHHDPWESDFEQDFPIRVARIACADSLGMSGMPNIAGAPFAVSADRQTNHRVAAKAGTRSHERNAGNPGLLPAQEHNPCPGVFALHVAEGVDNEAAEEVRTLDHAGLLGPDLIAVHGVGTDSDGVARWRASGAALCWCPFSNLFLFGRTAPAGLLADGLDVLLGSDSLLTGAGDLLGELRTASALGLLSGERLDAAVGATAARRLGLPAPDLTPASAADLVVLSRPLGAAGAADVQLVMVGGQPRVASLDLAAALAPLFPGGRLVQRGPLRRWVWGEIRDGTYLHRDADEPGRLVATSRRQ
jgi:hypothetical protein